MEKIKVGKNWGAQMRCWLNKSQNQNRSKLKTIRKKKSSSDVMDEEEEEDEEERLCLKVRVVR